MDIGCRIHNIIDDKDITQKELARRLDIPISTLNGYMTGKHQFPPEVIKAVAETLNVTADYLLEIARDPLRPMSLSCMERTLVEGFRTLSKEQKELILKNIHFMQEQNQR